MATARVYQERACEPSGITRRWAVLLARIFEALPLRCGPGAAQMRLIAFVTGSPGGENDPRAPG